MSNKEWLDTFTGEVAGILMSGYTGEQDQQIVEWNKQRNQLKWDKQLEYSMLKEEIDEFFKAKALVDMLDAFVDTIYVLAGSVAKAIYSDKIDELREITVQLDLVRKLLKMYSIMLEEFNKRNNVHWAIFPEELLKQVFDIVIDANNQKLKVGKNGKVEKPKNFVKPEERIYEAIKQFEDNLKGTNE